MPRILAFLIWPILLACVIGSYGCYSTDKVHQRQPSFSTETLHSIVLVDGKEIVFNRKGGHYRVSPTIVGTTTRGLGVAVPLDNVRSAWANRPTPLPFDSVWNTGVLEVLLRDSTLVDLTPPGARYSPAKRAFFGQVRGTTQIFSFDTSRVLEFRSGVGTPVELQRLASDSSLRIVELTLAEPPNKLVAFDSNGGHLGSPVEMVVGVSTVSDAVRVPLSDILYGTVERIDAAKTIIGVIGGAAIAVAVAAIIVVATKQSCPFIYAYDGAQYHFDAEPLGGATTEGLARTDYSQLEHLRPAGGTFRLLVRNEVNETQYIDAMSLCFVDHDSTRLVVAEGENTFRLLPQPSPPLSALDEHAADLMPFVSKIDGIAWQSNIEGLPETVDTIRQALTFRFAKPASARRALLVIKGGTTPWGSNVIRLMYEMLGNDVDRWYTEMDRRGPELHRILRYLESEELYALRVYVHRSGAWVNRGSIMGGGPFIHELQTVPLNVSEIKGPALEVQIHPPLGFWSFDYLGVVYDADSVCTGSTLPLLSAVDQNGRDISRQLGFEDRQYYEMPTNDDEAMLTFSAPPETHGQVRSLFVRTSGFYRLHLQKDQAPQTELMARLNSTPGSIVRYSLEKYRSWSALLHAQLRAQPQQ